jgi:dienelactone hydrolase
MADVLVFHHAQGLTEGVVAFADELRAAGHRVHTPDLYDGRTFTSLPAGMAFAHDVGFGTIIERGRRAAEGLDTVYVGLSLGVLPAQMLAQTRPGAGGAVLIAAAIALSEFGGAWPDGVPLQLHSPDPDEDVEVARELAVTVDGAELFLYPGAGHLFVDRSLPEHDPDAAALVTERVLRFLAQSPLRT